MIIKSVTEMAVKYMDDCCCRIFLRLEKNEFNRNFAIAFNMGELIQNKRLSTLFEDLKITFQYLRSASLNSIYLCVHFCENVFCNCKVGHAERLLPEYNKRYYVAKRSKHKKKSTSVLIKRLGYDRLRIFYLKKIVLNIC